jgi:glutamate--cysteine ligase
MTLRRTVPKLFRPRGPSVCTGLELELFALDADDGAPVPVARLQRVLARHPDVRVTYEPGGQVELAPRCRPSLRALLDDTEHALDRLSAILAGHGIVLRAAGMHPSADADAIGLQVSSPRYVAMQEHFDRIGPDGRRMMRATAGLQVCIDFIPGMVARQWRAAQLAAPVLAALFGTPGRSGCSARWSERGAA